jgi:MFS family permease
MTDTHDKKYELNVVILLTLGFGLVGLDRWIIAPLFPAMMKDLGLNYQDLGNLIGALGLAWGVFAVVAGGLSIASAVARCWCRRSSVSRSCRASRASRRASRC